jgi:NAD+ synthetase
MKIQNPKLNEPLNPELLKILDQIRKDRNFDPKKYIKDKCNLLNWYFKENKLSGAVIGVSGGIDSAIVLGLVMEASRSPGSPIKKVVPLLIPCVCTGGVTNQIETITDGEKVCKSLNIDPVVIYLHNIFHLFKCEINEKTDIKGDLWANGQGINYLRTPVLYYTTSLLSQEGFNSVVIGTTNLSEGGYIGYIGKMADGAVDIQLISDIYKSEVYQVAKELNIPNDIIKRIPTGDMYDSRVDEEVFGASYDFVELYQEHLRGFVPRSVIEDLSKKAKEQFNFFAKNLENLHKYNEHKYKFSRSPSCHLDIRDSKVIDGWNNNYWIFDTNKKEWVQR